MERYLSGTRFGIRRRMLSEFTKIKGWEFEKKFIAEYFSFIETDESPSTFNNDRPLQYFHNTDTHDILSRVLPAKDPYCSASFLVQIKFLPEYPSKVPEVIILDPIYHPNVQENGGHCCRWFNAHNEWKPTTSVVEIIKTLIEIIDNPDPELHCNVVCAEEYENDYEKYYAKAL